VNERSDIYDLGIDKINLLSIQLVMYQRPRPLPRKFLNSAWTKTIFVVSGPDDPDERRELELELEKSVGYQRVSISP
jgi:hypothetical protein